MEARPSLLLKATQRRPNDLARTAVASGGDPSCDEAVQLRRERDVHGSAARHHSTLCLRLACVKL